MEQQTASPAPAPRQDTERADAKTGGGSPGNAATPPEVGSAPSEPDNARTLPDRHAHSTESAHADGSDAATETEMPRGSQP